MAEAPVPEQAVPGQTVLRRRRRSLGPVAWCAVWLAVAVVGGVLTAVVVTLVGRVVVDDRDGFADLAAFVLGLLLGVAVAALVWLVATVVGWRRFVRPGRRLRTGALACGLVVVPAVLTAAVVRLAGAEQRGDGWTGWVLVVAAVVVPTALQWREDRRPPA